MSTSKVGRRRGDVYQRQHIALAREDLPSVDWGPAEPRACEEETRRRVSGDLPTECPIQRIGHGVLLSGVLQLEHWVVGLDAPPLIPNV